LPGGPVGTSGASDKTPPALAAGKTLAATVKNGVFTVAFTSSEAGNWKGLAYVPGGSLSRASASKLVVISSSKVSSTKAGKVKMRFKLNKKGKKLVKALKKHRKHKTKATVRLQGTDKAGNPSPALVRKLTLKR
jgi:hypothetical protein